MRFSTRRVHLGLLAVLLLAGCASPASSPTGNPPVSGSPIASTPAAASAPATQAPDTVTPASPSPTQPSSGDTSGGIRYTLVPGQSQASYKVREQLARLSFPTDAVGTTDQVSGEITLLPDGTIDSASSKFVVDLATLKTDNSMRDNYVRRSILQTDQYPQAVFVPKQVSGLASPLPTSGSVAFQLSGDLTLHGVTKPVTWEVSGTVQNDTASGTATTSFKFADFNLTQPQVPVVLSVVDNITLEVKLGLQRAASEGAAGPAAVAAQAGLALTPTAALAAAANCSSPAALTPALTEGPYFKPGSPERGSLFEAGMAGTRLTLTGYVLTADCQPVANALLDFWQADSQGQYDNQGYTLRGHQYTDVQGRYQLETVVPGLYPGRTEHIHVKVQAPGGPVLTTQLFFPGVSGNQTDQIFNPALVIQVQNKGESLEAGYNFIVSPR